METLIKFISNLSEFIRIYLQVQQRQSHARPLFSKVKRPRDIRGIPSHMLTEIRIFGEKVFV